MPKFMRFADHPEYGDVTRWAIAALVCGATAVFSANLAAIVPAHVLNGLHATYRDAASLDQMRVQVTALGEETSDIANDYRALLARFNLLDDDSGEVIRRLAAVEKSLPLLIESLPIGSDIDRSLLTASIVENGGEVYEAEGGTIRIRHTPLFDELGNEGSAAAAQPLPPQVPQAQIPSVKAEPPALDLAMQGIAVGAIVAQNEAVSAYGAIVERAGPLLLGTAPLMIDSGDPDRTRVVLGPLPDHASAEVLCERLMGLELACDPAPYQGLALPL